MGFLVCSFHEPFCYKCKSTTGELQTESLLRSRLSWCGTWWKPASQSWNTVLGAIILRQTTFSSTNQFHLPPARSNQGDVCRTEFCCARRWHSFSCLSIEFVTAFVSNATQSQSISPSNGWILTEWCRTEHRLDRRLMIWDLTIGWNGRRPKIQQQLFAR